MTEHIKRETVINHLDACMDTIWKPEIVALKCFVEGIPAADVAPARHGEWRESGPFLECQSCGEIYSRLGGNAGKLWNYCPNCGARMGGAE